MKRRIAAKLSAAAFVACVSVAVAQEITIDSPRGAQIRFTVENPNVQPASFTLVINGNGTGHYHSEILAVDRGGGKDFSTQAQDRDIHLSVATREDLFRMTKNHGSKPCDGGKPNALKIIRTLDLRGPDGASTFRCTYIWTKDDNLLDLNDKMDRIASTLDEGAKLTLLYQHQRLKLDEELESFTKQLDAGEALELWNIAPILRAIAEDSSVLNRAQRKAKALLVRVDAN